jgi:transcriptional regulator with XRE-family HTH domain
MSIFGNRLKELRIEHNYSLRQLAALTQISSSSLHFYENGDRNPKREAVEAVADVFNVDVEYLLGETDVRNFYANSYGVDSLAQHFSKEKAKRLGLEGGREVVFLGGSPYIKKPTDNGELSDAEQSLIDLFRQVPADQQELVLQMISVAVNKQQ